MATIEVKVPDIGDFEGVPVIEVLVKAGDVVKPEDALVTLESDKATMDVPAPAAGTVASVAVKVGDKVSEGSLVLVLEQRVPRPHPNPLPRAGARARLRVRRQPDRARQPRPGRPQRAGPDSPKRSPDPTRARSTSNARCWCWAPAPAATAPRSAPPTSA